MTDLSAEMLAAMKASTLLHAKALEHLGVSWPVIAELRRYHCGWGVVHAVEHPSKPGLYCLDPEAPPHLVLPVYGDGELVDIVAFRSSHPNNWLLRTGPGWALGVERGLERHTWGDQVSLALSPLEWLQQGASGLCVLDWAAPEVHYLTEVPHLVCSTEGVAALLRSALSKPVRFPEISICGGMNLAA